MKEWARSTNARYSSPRPRRKKSFMIWESCYPLVNKHSTYNVSDTVWYYVRILCLPASVPSDLSPPLTASISAVDVEEDRYRRLHQPQLVSVYWISFTSETKRWQSVAKACVSTRASVHDTHTHTHTHTHITSATQSLMESTTLSNSLSWNVGCLCNSASL